MHLRCIIATTTQGVSKPISKAILKQINTQKGSIEQFTSGMVYLPSKDDVRVVQVVVKRHGQSAYTIIITLDLETEGWKITDINGL